MHVLILLIIVGGIGYAVYKLRGSFGPSAPTSTTPPQPHDARDDQPGDVR